ncbi:MAG: serine hydrolase [Leptolyngbya sp. ERB_1_2]
MQVSGYGVDSQSYYAVIFEKTANAPAWVARHGLTSDAYQQEFNKWTAQGYRLVDINGHSVNNQDYYAAIFEKTANAPAWVARHGLTSAGYQNAFNQYTSQGYRLVKVSGYAINGEDRYAALWEKSGSGAWVARHGIPGQAYQDEFDRYFYQGYRPVWVDGYAVANQDRYAAIWSSEAGYNPRELSAIDELVQKYMQDYGVPGLSFAIAKDDRLVLAKTYGFADQTSGERVAPRHRFRIASVSKPLTAIALMSLVEQGKLKLSDKVFGTNGILGTQYGTSPYSKRVESLTIEHLLGHLGGGWSNDGNDPMFSNVTMSQADLITWTLNNRPLDHDPGTNYAYSNFGFCVLGRVIEKVMGNSYETYVRTQILNPSGAGNMQIAGNTLADKKANEVTYYGQGGEDPYGMNVTRMDSHGGWLATPIDLVKVLVRVDNLSGKSDLLKPATLTTMFTGSSVNSNYAKGWAVNTANNHWHNGSLPGEQAIAVNTSDGFSWAVLVNSRSQKPDFGLDLDKLMWNIKGKVTTWPTFDLF